jgi:hypothetical protein
MQSDAYITANKYQRQEMLENFDAITAGRKQAYEDDTSKKIDDARLAAQERYNDAIRSANNDRKRGLINEEEYQHRIAAAAKAQYESLEDIIAEYDLIDGQVVDLAENWGRTVRLNQENKKSLEAEKERKALLIDQEDTLAQQEIARAKEADLINQAIELEIKLIERQRQRARDALMQSDAYITASDTEREKILANFDAITEEMKRVQEEAKKTSLFDSKAFKTSMQIGEIAVGAFSDISSAMTEITQKQAEDAMAEIDRKLKEKMEDIEDLRTQALEAAGFIEATTSESMQAQIDAAKEANDEVLQYQLERRQEEMAINEKYDAEAKAAEEQATHDKLMLEYEAAMAKYEMDFTNAIIQGALAITNALATKPFIPVGIAAGAAAGVATGAQIAVIKENKPKLPKFADGGIVPGQPHGNVDTVMSMLTPGEVILNQAQQETLAPQLESRPLIIQQIMDGRKISEAVVNDYINKGIILIEARRGIR